MEQLDLVALLRALQQLERNAAVSLMYSGLRLPQFRLLEALSDMGEATVTQMSDRLAITRATASVLVNELIKHGAVAVIENLHDRRSFHIRITEAGYGKLRVARSDLAVFCDKLSRRFPAQTIELMNAFARELTTK